METPLLSKKQFSNFKRVLPVSKALRRIDDRLTISEIIWIIKKGVPWRQLPRIYGKWSTVCCRFRRWCKQGIFQKIFAHFSSKLKKRCAAMLDSTYIKAHRTACSLASDGKPRLLGRSRGGITTKIHLLCATGGKPMDFIVTGGEVSDIKIAPELVARNKMKALLADKAYQSHKLREQLSERRIKTCIPLNPIQNYPKILIKPCIVSGIKSKICFRLSKTGEVLRSALTSMQLTTKDA